jgi:glycosyltransferase involved in cell wall biosynthesis
MIKKAWLIHYEYHNSYKSKNLGLFARYLSKKYQVEFITTKIVSYESYDEDNVSVKEFLNENKNLLDKALINYIIKNIKNVEYIWCYNTNYKFIMLLLGLSKIYNTKVIIKLDSIWNLPKNKILSKLRYNVYNISLLLSYKILYESSELKEKIPFFLHKKCFKYLVSYSEIFAKKVTLNDLKYKENIILISARIYENKNIHSIMEIFIENIKFFKDWKLIIIGDDFDIIYANKLKKISKKYNNILFEGFKSGNDYYEYFKKAKIFILPSYQEGQPNVLVEAIYFGCHVFITKNANVDEFVDNKFVEYINPFDKDSMQSKLISRVRNYNNDVIEYNHIKCKNNYLFEDKITRLLND